MMKSYGQYCPVARAAQILGQRWTLLVLRDLLGGSRRFNDLRRGVPLMSPSLLSRRLKELEACGLVERTRKSGSRGTDYAPTPAALELLPVINLLGAWGQRWLPAQIAEEELDVSLLMWDVSHRVDPEQLGPGRTVIAFEYTDRPRLKKDDWWLDRWWLVVLKGESELCIQDPGFDVDLLVVTDLATMTGVWMNHVSVRKAVSSGAIRLEGSRLLADSFHRWLPLSVHARHPRPPEPLDLDHLLAVSRAEISA